MSALVKAFLLLYLGFVGYATVRGPSALCAVETLRSDRRNERIANWTSILPCLATLPHERTPHHFPSTTLYPRNRAICRLWSVMATPGRGSLAWLQVGHPNTSFAATPILGLRVPELKAASRNFVLGGVVPRSVQKKKTFMLIIWNASSWGNWYVVERHHHRRRGTLCNAGSC